MKKPTIKGYKVFNPDFKCRDFQFAENTKYKHKGNFKICESGFHFCINVADCFSYYNFDPKNVVCEVEALGDTQTHSNDSKVATNHLKVGKIVPWSEVLELANKGSNNLGYKNAGNYNAGNHNAGNYNAGYRNAGYRNAGNDNAGNDNAGNYNAGNDNAGNYNAGNRNAGYRNAGNDNAGNYNAGNRNAGNYNAGNRNAGYSNAGNDNAGAFNTQEDFKMFNKKCKWTFEDFRASKAFKLLHSINTNIWISSNQMSEQEKINYPYFVTTSGYNKIIPYKEAFLNAWNNWSDENKKEFTSLPNFSWEIFTFITGVEKE